MTAPPGMVRRVLDRYAFLPALLAWPRALSSVGRALFRPMPWPVFAYTDTDLWLRCYYRKVARNFREAGRHGWVWDEALGSPMAPRYYSNWATYRIYGALSARAFSVLSAGAFLASVVATGAACGVPVHAGVIALLLTGSPAVLHGLVGHGVKPEVLWWAAGVPVVAAAAQGVWVLAWAAIGALLWLNTTVSVLLLVGVSVPAVHVLSSGAHPGGAWLLLLAPGLGKQAYRAWRAQREGFLGTSASSQRAAAKAQRPRLVADIAQLVELALWLGLATWGDLRLGALLFGGCAVVFVVNGHVLKVADGVTLRLLFLSTVVAGMLSRGAWPGLAGVLLCAFHRPWAAKPPAAGRKEYPWLEPKPFPGPPGLVPLFQAMPRGSRLFMECDGDPRHVAGYWRFHDWTNEILPDLGVEFPNQTYLMRFFAPELADRLMDRLNATALGPDGFVSSCRVLGATHVLAYSSATCGALEQAGCERVAVAAWPDIAAFGGALAMPSADLALYRLADAPGIISPATEWRRGPNELRWVARRSQRYVVRYRHHAAFRAWLGETPVPVQADPVDAAPGVRFMAVESPGNGELALRFGATGSTSDRPTSSMRAEEDGR